MEIDEDTGKALAAANDWLWRIAGPDSPAIRLQLGMGIEELERLGSPYCRQRLQAIRDYLTREQGEGKSASAEENPADCGGSEQSADDEAMTKGERLCQAYGSLFMGIEDVLREHREWVNASSPVFREQATPTAEERLREIAKGGKLCISRIMKRR